MTAAQSCRPAPAGSRPGGAGRGCSSSRPPRAGGPSGPLTHGPAPPIRGGGPEAPRCPGNAWGRPGAFVIRAGPPVAR
eukprot:453441-Alexandrium_andersonii.AAC.1